METVANLNETTIEQLKDLVRINIDSAGGFRSAADSIDNESLGQTFKQEAVVRDDLAMELKRFVEMNNEDVELTGSLKGRLHRWWIDVRGAIQDGDEYAILAEAERGEDAIKACYEEALKDNPGNAVSDLLHEQLRTVKETHDRIRDLRDAWKAKKKKC